MRSVQSAVEVEYLRATARARGFGPAIVDSEKEKFGLAAGTTQIGRHSALTEKKLTSVVENLGGAKMPAFAEYSCIKREYRVSAIHEGSRSAVALGGRCD